MRHLLLVPLAGLIAFVVFSGSAAEATHPHPVPADMISPSPAIYVLPHVLPGGYPRAAPATPYAYGWFGVPRRRHHGGAHYGHYHDYRQHSHR